MPSPHRIKRIIKIVQSIGASSSGSCLEPLFKNDPLCIPSSLRLASHLVQAVCHFQLATGYLLVFRRLLDCLQTQSEMFKEKSELFREIFPARDSSCHSSWLRISLNNELN
jgi:hypothetical protein